MYKSALAALLLLPLLALSPEPADAHATVRVYLGIPYYTYRVNRSYVYRSGYGWYYPRRGYAYGLAVGRLSCGQAARIVDRGYSRVSAIDCSGRTYAFRASRNGNRYTVYVNSRTGAMWRSG
jgi:hypothetical protein